MSAGAPSLSAHEVLDYPFPRPDALSVPTEYRSLRERCPLAHVRFPSGDTGMLATRYADVKLALSDERFSHNLFANPRAARLSPTQLNILELEEVGKLADPSRYTRIRRLVSKAFSARGVDALRPSIQSIGDELIDTMLAQGPPCDAVPALAQALPGRVIGEIFGTPNEDLPLLARWSSRLFSVTRHTAQDMAAAQMEFAGYMWNLVETRRAQPTADLLSELVGVTDAQDGRLSDIELMIVAQALLALGFETTSVMIGRMLGLLLHVPDRYRRLVAAPELVESAVEEVLRFDPQSSITALRIATDDVRLGEETVPASTTLAANIAAANRDPRVFERPDEFIIDRTENRHLTFGYGMHHCLGAALARAEMQILLRTLIARIPALALAADLSQLSIQSDMLNDGLASLPVRW
jgi:cytochrome P450